MSHTRVDLGAAVELPEDVFAEIERLANQPHHNARVWTQDEDSILMAGKQKGLTWDQIRSVMRKYCGDAPSSNRTLLERYRELTGEGNTDIAAR